MFGSEFNKELLISFLNALFRGEQNVKDYTEAIPAFITIVMMPLSYSISDGILCGIIAYVAINILCCNWKKLNPTLYILAALFVMKYIFI